MHKGGNSLAALADYGAEEHGIGTQVPPLHWYARQCTQCYTRTDGMEETPAFALTAHTFLLNPLYCSIGCYDDLKLEAGMP